MKERFLGLIENSIRKNWELPAMTDFQGATFYYKDFAKEIDKLHAYFKATGIEKGDKIALAGRNSARWAITFFATLSYGAVVVSILHEFDKESIEYIIDHSEAKICFVDETIYKNLEAHNTPHLKSIFLLEDYTLAHTSIDGLVDFARNADDFFTKKYTDGFSLDNLHIHTEKSEELAILNYTSGTTSSPKGVMIPYRSVWSNTKFANDNLPFVTAGDNIVCMLPMAHTYGLAFEILNSISMGCHIHFLSKVPSPKIIMEAFAKANPTLVLAVPLIIEKIVTKNVFPKIQKQPVKTLLKLPFLNIAVKKKIRKSMVEIFGKNMAEVVIGGAGLNREVEAFLHSIKFPYTVGYGMTECGPLISYAYWKEFKPKSCGKIVDRMQAKIDSPKPDKIPGEILVKGANVMLGYYKNPVATEMVMHRNNWMKTGDLGVMDKDGFLFIRGRSKNMILGASGQNIYPEEIEGKVNASDYIAESLVVEENGKIIALLYPDADAIDAQGIKSEEIRSFLDQEIAHINKKLPSYCRIKDYRIQEEEFEKTPKRSIRRFKYQN